MAPERAQRQPNLGQEECADDVYESVNYRRRLPEITRRVAQSCTDEGTYDHVGAEMIPSWGAVVETVDLLRDVLFPGYFGEQHIDESALEYHLGTEISVLFDSLSNQIARSVRHDCIRYNQMCGHCANRGQREAITFLEKIPRLRHILGTDVRAAYAGDPAAKTHDEIVFAYPGLFTVMVYRVAHELWRQGIPLLPRMMTEYAHSKTGIDIHPGATIGESFFIDHGTGVVIGETAEVGARVRLYQGVTIGARSLPRDEQGDLLRSAKRHPTVEEDVTIYANATILGGDTVIGARSIVGASVFLTESVPPDTVVMPEHPPLTFRSASRPPLRDLA